MSARQCSERTDGALSQSLKLADDLEKLRATVRVRACIHEMSLTWCSIRNACSICTHLQLANKRNKMKEDSEALEELRAAIQNVYMDSVRHIDIGCIESDSLRQRIDPSGVAQAAHDDLRKCEIEKQELEEVRLFWVPSPAAQCRNSLPRAVYRQECRRISRRSGTERSAGDCDGSAVSHRPRLSNAPHSVEDEGHDQRTEPHREQRHIQSESEDQQISEASTSFVVEVRQVMRTRHIM